MLRVVIDDSSECFKVYFILRILVCDIYSAVVVQLQSVGIYILVMKLQATNAN